MIDVTSMGVYPEPVFSSMDRASNRYGFAIIWRNSRVSRLMDLYTRCGCLFIYLSMRPAGTATVSISLRDFALLFIQ
jgi:hypothetical protein